MGKGFVQTKRFTSFLKSKVNERSPGSSRKGSPVPDEPPSDRVSSQRRDDSNSPSQLSPRDEKFVMGRSDPTMMIQEADVDVEPPSITKSKSIETPSITKSKSIETVQNPPSVRTFAAPPLVPNDFTDFNTDDVLDDILKDLNIQYEAKELDVLPECDTAVSEKSMEVEVEDKVDSLEIKGTVSEGSSRSKQQKSVDSRRSEKQKSVDSRRGVKAVSAKDVPPPPPPARAPDEEQLKELLNAISADLGSHSNDVNLMEKKLVAAKTTKGMVMQNIMKTNLRKSKFSSQITTRNKSTYPPEARLDPQLLGVAASEETIPNRITMDTTTDGDSTYDEDGSTFTTDGTDGTDPNSGESNEESQLVDDSRSLDSIPLPLSPKKETVVNMDVITHNPGEPSRLFVRAMYCTPFPSSPDDIIIKVEVSCWMNVNKIVVCLLGTQTSLIIFHYCALNQCFIIK